MDGVPAALASTAHPKLIKLIRPLRQGSHSLEKYLNFREVLEKSLKSIFLEKSLNFCASPWKVLEFSSTLNVVAWKEFFDAFWLSETEYKS